MRFLDGFTGAGLYEEEHIFRVHRANLRLCSIGSGDRGFYLLSRSLLSEDGL